MFSHSHDKDDWSHLQSLLTTIMGYLGFTWKAPKINIFMESASDVFSTIVCQLLIVVDFIVAESSRGL